MKVAVLGTGAVGQAMNSRLSELGHDVRVGTRDVQGTKDRGGPDAALPLATFAEAAAHGELIINATSGNVSLAVLNLAGADNLAGKVLIDISNPLDFSAGFPPTLSVKDTDSVGEQIQAAFPDARVVKSLNTMTAEIMVHPADLGDGVHAVFVSGNDAAAKQIVTELLQEFGHVQIIDLGDISTARGPEMYLPLWLRLMGALGTPMFNVKIVK